MDYPVYNIEGKNVGTLELPKEIFEVKLNNDLIHQAVTAQRANARNIWAHAKGRSEVRGGGKKPWKQKGTGRSRHGSIRSPLWIGGGVTAGPTKERNFSQKINRKMKRKAIFMALSDKVRNNTLIVLDGLFLKNPKTKEVEKIIKNLKLNVSNLKEKPFTFIFALDKKDENLTRGIRNLSYAKSLSSNSLNIVDLLSFNYLILSKTGIEVIKEVYLEKVKKEIENKS